MGGGRCGGGGRGMGGVKVEGWEVEVDVGEVGRVVTLVPKIDHSPFVMTRLVYWA